MNEKPPSSGSRVEDKAGASATPSCSPTTSTRNSYENSPRNSSGLNSGKSQTKALLSSARKAGDPSMDVRLQIMRFEADAIKERAAEASANEKLAEARIIELESQIRINLQRFEDYERRLQAAALDLSQEKKYRAQSTEEFQHRMEELNSDLARARTALQIKQDEVDRLRLLSEALKRDIESIDQPRLSQLISELTSSLETERSSHQQTQTRSIELQDELTQKLSELSVMKNKFLGALDQRQVEKQALLSDIEQLKSQIESLQKEKSDLILIIEQDKATQQRLADQLEQSDSSGRALKSEIERLKAELEKTSQELAQALEEKISLSALLKDKENEGFHRKDKILQVESRAASFQEKVGRLEGELKDAIERYDLLEKEKAKLEAQLQEQAEANLQLKNSLFMSETRASSVQGQFEQCRAELALASESVTKQTEVLEQERARSTEILRKYSQLEFVLEQVKLERQHDSEIAAQRLSDLSLSLEQEKEKHQNVQKDVASQLEEIRKYSERLHEQELTLLQLNTELKSRQNHAEELSALMQQARVKYEEATTQLAAYQSELDRERTLKAALESRQSKLDQEIKDIYRQNEEATNRISAYKSELERERALKATLESRQISLDHEIKELYQEKEKVNARLSTYKSDLERERALKATLESRQVSLDHEIKKLFQEKEEIYRISNEKIEKERAENLNWVARYENLETEAFAAKSKIEALTSEIDSERAQNQTAIQNLNEQIQDLREQHSQVALQLERTQELVQIKQDEVERLRHLNESIKRDLESIDQPAMNQAIAELHESLETERKEHLESQARNIELQDSLSKRLSELSLIKSKLSDCADQRQQDEVRFRKEIEAFQSQLEQLTQENARLGQYEALAQELRSEVDQRNDQIESLKIKIQEKEQALSVLQQKLFASQEEKQALKVSAENAAEKLTLRHQSELALSHQRQQQLSEKIDDFKVELARLNQRLEASQSSNENSTALQAELSARSVEFERRLQAVNQELVEERSAARHQSKHLQEQLDALTRELSIRQAEIEKFQAQSVVDRQGREKEQHKQELQILQLNSELEKSSREREELTRELNASGKRIEALEGELALERRHREEFHEKSFAQKSEFSEKAHAYEIAALNLRNEIKQRDQEVRTLEDALKQREERASDLVAELQELREHLKQSTELVAQERQLLEQERMQSEALSARCSRAESSSRLKQEEVEKLRHLNESLRRDIESMDVENLKRMMAEQAQELELERRKSADTAKLCSELQESLTRQRSEMGLLQNSLTSVLEKTRDEAYAQPSDSHHSLDEAMQSLISQKLQLESELAQASESKRQTRKVVLVPKVPRARKKSGEVEI